MIKKLGDKSGVTPLESGSRDPVKPVENDEICSI